MVYGVSFSTLLFSGGLLLLGVGAVIFARPLAVWEYKFDVRFKMTFGIGINVRVWYCRVGGIILIGTALFVLVQGWASHFT